MPYVSGRDLQANLQAFATHEYACRLRYFGRACLPPPRRIFALCFHTVHFRIMFSYCLLPRGAQLQMLQYSLDRFRCLLDRLRCILGPRIHSCHHLLQFVYPP